TNRAFGAWAGQRPTRLTNRAVGAWAGQRPTGVTNRAFGAWAGRRPTRLTALRHQAAANRAQHQLRRTVQVHFLHDAPAVSLDRMQTQVEPVGDIFIAIALGQELVELALAIGERFVAVRLIAGILQARDAVLKDSRHRRAE